MKSKLFAVGIAVLASLAFASTAAAATPTTTVQANLPGFNFGCGATAFGPTFETTLLPAMSYQGGTSCSYEGASRVYKEVTAYAQVYNSGLQRWFTIAGSAVATNLARVNPQQTGFGVNTYVTGHVYRIVADAVLEAPNGYAGCSLHGPWACYERVNVTAVGAAFKAPTAPTAS
jgi:hypothetical protein